MEDTARNKLKETLVIFAFVRRDSESPRKPPVRRLDLAAEIRTWNPQNTAPEC
jgi:hypothetical protein